MVCTRFAPSPTGFLHIGSARTALYSWLYARHHGGKFILRIEDTDLERSTDVAVQAILDGMHWLGLTYDEGPYYQTKRFDRYRAVAEQLLAEKKAYRCYCSKERLEKLRSLQIAQKEKPRYDGQCRQLTAPPTDASTYVIRFLNPLTGTIVVDDLLLGEITFNQEELDDLIIMRSDHTPTYNFTVVVDDWEMGITHVIRGNDHLNNTPRQMNILLALGASIPQYTHLPVILGPDGKKMSKRHGAESVMQFRDEGFLPHALLNYLVRLGWSYGDQEIFSANELIRYFDIKSLNKSAAVFDVQKLLWLNQHYIKTMPAQEIIPHLQWHFDKLGLNLKNGPPLEQLIPTQAERVKTLRELAEKSYYFYQDITGYDEKAVAKLFTAEVVPGLQLLQTKLNQLNSWLAPQIHHVLNEASAECGYDSMGKLAQPLRLAVTGGTISPPIDTTLELLGKEKVLQRIQAGISFIEASAKPS